MICNYHEPFEGRCDLDRFFAVMTGFERKYKIRGLDIIGILVFVTFSNT